MTSEARPEASLPEEPGEPTLDERVLITGTTERFVLLLVLCVAVSVGAAHEAAGHLARAWGGRLLVVLLPYLASAALAIAAGWLYRKLPGWRVRRGRLVPIAEIADGGRVRAELDRLWKRSHLRVEPAWFYAPGAPSAGAAVLGTHRHPQVCLDAGLVACATLAPATFRAVVLHELAHIRNRDVGITYATESMWRALMAMVLLPKAVVILIGVVLGGVITPPVSLNPYDLAQDALIVALVYLTRADILRTREIYADRTAVHLWHVDPADLLPARGERPLGQGRLARLRTAAVEVWHTHPSWRLRGRALADSETLFAQRAFPLLLTGLAADIAATRLTSPFRAAGEWPAATRDAMTSMSGSSWAWPALGQYLLVGGLTAQIGGVVLWRAVLHAVLTGRSVPAGWWAGLWLGAGLALGELSNAGVREGQPLPARPEVLVLLVAVAVLLMSWTAQYAELRIRTYRGRSINLHIRAGLLVPGLVLAFVLLWWVREAWITGWHFSVTEALEWAELPAHDAPLAVRVMAILTALPGSDMGFTGLWWSVPLLWLVPLRLWLARRPLPTVGNRFGRIRRAGARRRARRLQLLLEQVQQSPDHRPPDLVTELFAGKRAAMRVLLRFVAYGGVVFLGLLLLLSFLTAVGRLGGIVPGMLLWSVILLIWRRIVLVIWHRHGRDREGYWLDLVRPGSVLPAAHVPELVPLVRIGVVGGLLCCAGILAEPMVTGSAAGGTGWRIDSIENLAWITVVTGTVMLVTGVVAGWTAHGRHPVLTALVASGLSGLIGLLCQSVRGVLDGCLGPANSLARTCTWQPGRYAPLVEYALGYVMTLGLLAAAGGAALSHALATVLRARRRLSGPPRGTTDAPRMAGRRPVIEFLHTITMGLVLSTTVFQTLVVSAPLHPNDLLIQYAISPTGPGRSVNSPLIDRMSHLEGVRDRTADARHIMAEALATMPATPQRHDVIRVAKRLEPACATWTGILRDAEDRGRRISMSLSPDLEQAWDHYLAETRITRDHCLTATEAETAAEFDEAVEELLPAMENQTKALTAAIDIVLSA
ncbi:M48 family metalloprotease [Streptomyces sp. NRRL S-37]|uniref:M48 family metalloprotease n=1 Tax=Streptomyces sp. NRRL S-37 TaxID=1463903 RepID=UPI0004C79B82|nr:M48 family metalloprotease [Streptomyces sp. NRRL S-37]